MSMPPHVPTETSFSYTGQVFRRSQLHGFHVFVHLNVKNLASLEVPLALMIQGKMGTSPMQVAMASNPEHNEGAVMGSFIGLVSAKFCDEKRPADRGP